MSVTSLTRWDPFQEIVALSNAMDSLFENGWGRRPIARRYPVVRMYGTRHLSPRRFLPIDLFETDDELVIKTAMPGVDPEHLDVKIKGDVLTIHGEAKEDEEVQGATYHLRERRNGTFSRAITLPVPVQAKKAKAVFEDGVLTLTLPKSEEVKPKTIKVKKK